MRVRDVMSSPVVTVAPGTRPKQAAMLLVRRGFNALPVVDEGGLVGIVTEADLIPLEVFPDRRAHALPQPEPAGDRPRTIREVMTEEVLALPEDADAADAARLMLQHGIKSIPIVSGRRVTGIVSRRDLLRVLARNDLAIRADVERLLAQELGDLPRGVEVADGVVTLTGFADASGRELAELLASTIPGVIEVRFAPAP